MTARAEPAPGGSPPRPPRRDLRPPRPRMLSDVVVAGVAFLVLGVPSLRMDPQAYDPAYLFLGISALNTTALGNTLVSVIAGAAAIGMPLAVVWRAYKPVHSTVIVYVFALAHFVAGVYLAPVDLLIFLSLYSVTIYGPPWASNLGLAGALVGGFLLTILFIPYTQGFEPAVVGAILFAFAGALVLLAWGAGLLRRSRVEQREALRERARRLERERDQQAQIATVAERNRIAREMHDIVAHSLSVVIAQADGGRYAATADPEAATRALETISETGRATLTDMRRILGVLRDEDGTTADLIPQPDDADLATLITHVKDAGLTVSQVSLGHPQPLPPGTGVAVYRIVQESLTNILKHAGPAANAIVTTQWEPAQLTVTVDDDGRGAAALSDRPGHGLVGMRERATMLGGTLSAGPRPGGGFRVRVHIPLPKLGSTVTS